MIEYEFPGLLNYWIVFLLMMIGLYIVISHENLIKKIVGLNVFQVSVFVFYISMAKIKGRHRADFGRRDRGLFQSPAPCSDPDGHCRRRCDDGAGAGARRTCSGKLRHHRRR